MTLAASNFLFFGFLAGQPELRRAFAGDPAPQVSAVKFQTALVEGLAGHGARLRIVAALPIASYPTSDTLLVRGAGFSTRFDSASGHLMGAVNLPILKLFVRLVTTLYHGARSLRAGEGRDGIFVYSLHTPFLAAAVVLKRVFKVRVFVFVLDLPMHMAGKELKGLHRMAKLADDWLLRTLMASADIAFPITATVARDWLPPSLRHLVVEGIAPDERPASLPASEPHPRPRLLYTGSFSHVLKFAGMFSRRRDIDASLVFVGGGPDEAELKELARQDPRIVVEPFVTGEELNRKFQSADFLLSPRDTRWEGARYSFPSKLFDYMARGRPILSTRMPGVPDEYFDCFIEVADADADRLAESLKKALATPREEIVRRIEVGEAMLSGTKSAKAVTGRILEAVARC